MDDIVKKAMVSVLAVPILAFIAAGVTELRSNLPLHQRIIRVFPICCGLLAVITFVDPQRLFDVTPSGSVVLSRVMTLISALIACSGSFVTYSRRRSAI